MARYGKSTLPRAVRLFYSVRFSVRFGGIRGVRRCRRLTANAVLGSAQAVRSGKTQDCKTDRRRGRGNDRIITAVNLRQKQGNKRTAALTERSRRFIISVFLFGFVGNVIRQMGQKLICRLGIRQNHRRNLRIVGYKPQYKRTDVFTEIPYITGKIAV